MGSLLVKVKLKLSIHAHEKVRGLLEGQYGSVFKGRSLDFDDLREYLLGDDIKDIDWRASARSGQMRIKRYVAIRKHNILLVVDTGRGMSAAAASGERKKDITIMASGIIGYIAQKHGDLVALVASNSAGSHYLPLKGSEEHLERILQYISANTSRKSPQSNLLRLLEYVARNIRRRMMLVVITDDLSFGDEHERLLRRLKAQHEILWLTVGDADITDSRWKNDPLYSSADSSEIPLYLRQSSVIKEEFLATDAKRQAKLNHTLKRLGISSQRITSEATVVNGIIRLLERQRHGK